MPSCVKFYIDSNLDQVRLRQASWWVMSGLGSQLFWRIYLEEIITFNQRNRVVSYKASTPGNKGQEAGLGSTFFDQFDANPFHQYLGLEVHSAARDRVTLRLFRSEETPTGIGGSVNGGVLATMVDMAAVAAVFTNLPDGFAPAGTADLQITYLRQASGDHLDAVAEVIKRGRQLCTIQVVIVDPRGVQCCVGRVLYAVRPSQIK